MYKPENRFWSEKWCDAALLCKLPRRLVKKNIRLNIDEFIKLFDVRNLDFFDEIIRADHANIPGNMTRIFAPADIFDHDRGTVCFCMRTPWFCVDSTDFDGFIAELLTRTDLIEKIFDDIYPPELLSILGRHGINPLPQPENTRIYGAGISDSETITSDGPELETLINAVSMVFSWILFAPEKFFTAVVGDIKAALKTYGVVKDNPITAIPRTFEKVLSDESQLVTLGAPFNKTRAYRELLYFGLQPFASIGMTVNLILPPYVSECVVRRDMLHRQSISFRGPHLELLTLAQKQIKKWFTALEAGENDFETNERRPQTLWEETIADWSVDKSEFIRLQTQECKTGTPFDLHFVMTFDSPTQGEETKEAWSEDILPVIMTMPRWMAQDAPELAVVWRAITRMAAKLLISGSLVPTPVWHKESLEVNYLWLPAMYLPEVAERVSRLATLIHPYIKELFPKSMQLQGKYAAEQTAMRALTLAVSALLRQSAWAKKSIARLEIIERLTASTFGYTNPVINENFFIRIQSNRFASRCVYNDMSALFLRTAFPEELVVNIRNLGGGTVAAGIGFTPKKTQIATGRLTGIDQVLANPRNHTALARVAQCAVKTYKETFSIFKRYDKVLAKELSALAKTKGNRLSAPVEVKLTTSEIEDFLFNEMPKCAAAGIYVRLPDVLKNLIEPKLVAVADAGKTLETKGFLDKYSLADFRWEAAVGDTRIPLEELQDLVKQAGHLVSYGDQFIMLTMQSAERIEGQLTANKRVTNWDKLRAVLTGCYEGAVVEATEPVRERLNALLKIDELPPPEGLNTQLRPYQARGYSWLMKNLRLGLGALIADDMGLGKTVQVIAALLQLKNEGELTQGSVLVVVPASVLTNWMRELTRFAPKLSVTAYHGQNRKLPGELPDVVVTSYRILANDLEDLSRRKWRLMVIDEAQAIKNSSTEQSTAVRHFPAPQVIAMSGTPVENRLQEYWSIMAAVQPKLLGSLKSFRETFARPIEEERSELVLEQFRRLTRPFMIRRMKSDKDIQVDLPDRETIDYFTTLTPEQTALYEDCLKVSLSDLDTLMKEALESETTKELVDKAALIASLQLKRRGNILRMITHLKQIVNSPSHFQKKHCDAPDSGKGKALMDLLAQCFENNRKVLVFTQFTEMGHLLVDWIAGEFGRKPDFLHGGVSIHERQAMIDRFQNDIQSKVLVLSLKAGGLGLNLTSASAVIHYDLWWNPAVEAQANDRAYRIGQNRDVVVYRFITEGTFEERLNQMIERKKELADVTVGTGEAWIGDLSNREIEEIFKISR